jgi:hypothetical protein
MVAQLLPAIPKAFIGIRFGPALFGAVSHDSAVLPSERVLGAVLLLTLIVVSALTAIPACIGARRSVAAILQSETV